MTAYKDLSKEELLELKSGLEAQFEEVKAKGLKLDMSRGKPSADQLNLSMGMMDTLTSGVDLTCEDGVDCRNYGGLDGIDEAKAKQKDSEITEDELKVAETEIQKITDKNIEEIDNILADKETEIMSV